MLIVGLTGKIGVGKTTIADMIVSILNANGYHSVRGSFGDGLRYSMNQNLEIPLDVLYDNSAKQKPIKELPGFETFYPAIQGCSATAHITPDDLLRKVYQDYAQACRQQNPDVWVDMLKKRELLLDHTGVTCMVVDDVRQENELEYCNQSCNVLRIHEYVGYNSPSGSEHYVESGFPEHHDRISEIYPYHYGVQHLNAAAIQISKLILQSFKESEYNYIIKFMKED